MNVPGSSSAIFTYLQPSQVIPRKKWLLFLLFHSPGFSVSALLPVVENVFLPYALSIVHVHFLRVYFFFGLEGGEHSSLYDRPLEGHGLVAGFASPDFFPYWM